MVSIGKHRLHGEFKVFKPGRADTADDQGLSGLKMSDILQSVHNF